MEITTIRLPESMKEAIEREAEERELSPTEYMRTILRNRKQITMEQSAEESEGDYAELVDRLEELEQRVDQLEDQPSTLEYEETATEAPQSDVVEYVRKHQPVSRKDIIAAFTDEIEAKEIQGDSWWRRHARPELKESNAQYTKNVGWQLE